MRPRYVDAAGVVRGYISRFKLGTNLTADLADNGTTMTLNATGGEGGGPHDHDGVYSDVDHEHDAAYEALGHNHNGTYEAGGSIATHEAAGNPHPAYALDTDLTTHEGAADPHGGYVKESDASWVELTDASETELHSHPAGAGGLSGDQIVDLLYPVGSLYISTLSTNPGTLLSHGTWAAFGAGRVLVGLDSGDADFDTAEETGGAKTHTLQASEMPSHTHTQDAHTHTQNAHSHTQQRFPTTTGGSTGFTVDTSMSGTPAAANATSSDTATNQNATATNQNTGGGGAHNNLQPYVVVYMWKRTA